MTGTVTLVGAGPGGRGLLTLAGAKAVRAAEVVVYDRLASPEILELASPSAELVNVGKEQSHHPAPQEEINALLVRYARAGKNTVRLKGGDCFLFGRGGEECEVLRANGIPFRVIPGVSSALAAPAFAGIPVTHRDYSSSVHIITGHAQRGRQPDIDYWSLVKLRGTLVFLMGVTALREICSGLLAAGMDPCLPAAAIENGGRPAQRKLLSTVCQLPDEAEKAGLKSPAAIVVGKVCGLSENLDWYSVLPLHGKRIAVTRPKERAGTLSDRLRQLGAEVIECPCIETVLKEDQSALKSALSCSFDWAAFTSPAGVHLTVQALKAIGRDLRELYGLKLAAVGRGTAEALEQYGLTADLVPTCADGAHLAEALLSELPPDGAVLILRGTGGDGALPERLLAADMVVADIALYETVLRPDLATELRERLTANELDAAAFTSASAVRAFGEAVKGCAFAGFPAVCIGPKTAREAERLGLQAWTARDASISALADCAVKALGVF